MSFAPYVPRLAATWSGPPARELDGSLVSIDISGFTALSERLQTRGRAGAEELVLLVSGIFDGLIGSCERLGGDVLKFRGDALLIFFPGGGALEAATEMQAQIAGAGETMSSVGPVSLSMSAGVYSGPCQFFIVEGTHRELVVAGPAATRVIQLEDEASAGEIKSDGADGSGVELERSEQTDLEQFVPVPLRAQLQLEQGEAEHRHVTAAFLKFSGTDALSLEDTLAQLVPLAELVGDTCAELGLTWLESDIDVNGGKLYLVAGAPSSTGEDEERMLRALRRVLDDYDGTLTLRAGVNHGNAFCGDIGSASRRTYAVMGDTVNLAARLAARAEPGSILATGGVLDRARTTYETRLQPFLLKGKERAVSAYHVGAATGERREETAAELPIVGREAELAALAEALTAARMRQQRYIELVGEPGIGKSRLVGELKRQALGFTQLEARCDPYSTARPYFALRALLRPLVGIAPEADERTAGEQLAPWVESVMPDLAPSLPLLAIPFGAEVASTEEADRLDPGVRRERLLDAVEQFLARVLMMPTLIAIEDVHWADDASFELVRHLVRRPAERPWLVCATRRPQGLSLAADVDGHVRLELARLGDDAAEALALEAAGEVALTSEVLAAVRERSGGNPLFVRELVNAARTGDGSLPESVETLITSRIDTLSPEDRYLLRNASVLGARFELGVLEEVLAGELDDAGGHEQWQRLAEFVTWDGPAELRFVHDLFRAVSYEGMSFARRREVHARVGDVLAARGAEPALLSLHFLEAERYEQAWEYAVAAADQARAQFANVVAAELYERALVSAEHLDLPPAEVARVCEALGDVAELFASYDRAEAAYRRARSLGANEARVLMKLARVREPGGHYDEAIALLERAITVVEDEETATDCENSLAGLLFRQGRFEESVDASRRAIERGERAGVKSQLAYALLTLEATLQQLGRDDPTLAPRALALFEELDDQPGIARTLNNMGIGAYYSGDWNAALDLYERAREAYERTDAVEGAAMSRQNIGEILSDQGRYAEAEPLFRDTLRVARASGNSLVEAFVTANLGRLAARSLRFDQAHALLGEAREQLAAIGSGNMVLETDARKVECFVLEGRYTEARELAEAAIVRAAELGRTHTLGPQLERALGYALCQARAPAEGIPHFQESLRIAREASADYDIAMTLRALADTNGGDRGEADELLARLGVVACPPVPLP